MKLPTTEKQFIGPKIWNFFLSGIWESHVFVYVTSRKIRKRYWSETLLVRNLLWSETKLAWPRLGVSLYIIPIRWINSRFSAEDKQIDEPLKSENQSSLWQAHRTLTSSEKLTRGAQNTRLELSWPESVPIVSIVNCFFTNLTLVSVFNSDQY